MNTVDNQEKIKYYGFYTKKNTTTTKEYWAVFFYDKIQRKNIKVCTCNTEKEAKIALGKAQYKFYKNYPLLLPNKINFISKIKNIDTFEGDNMFSLHIRHPLDNHKSIFIGFFTTIQDAIWAKKELASTLAE